MLSTIVQIRGTNGSGKTTLARSFYQSAGGANVVHLTGYQKQLKHGPKSVSVPGWASVDTAVGPVCLVGDYSKPQGGLDTIPSFEVQQEAVARATAWATVICEGVLASTVAGSWLDFFRRMRAQGHRVVVGYMDTPLDVCLQRIQRRQEAAGRVRDIKEELVADKVRSIAATRPKLEDAGIECVTLPWQSPRDALLGVLRHER